MRLGAAHLFVLFATVQLTDASGAGASIYFDGHDDYASVFPGFQLLDDWTIEFWVKPTSLATVGQCVLSFQTFGGDNLLTFTSRPVAAWQVLYGPDAQGIPEDAWTSTDFDGLYQAANTHVALTHQVFPDLSTSELSLYFNSGLRASWNVTTTAAAQIMQQQQVLPVTLGACYEDTEAANEEFGRGIFRTKFFDGHMDEVRWWSVVRTETGVAETWVFSGDPLYWPVPATTVPTSPTSGKTVDTTDTLVVAQANAIRAKYSFDQTENNLIDGSGNSLHGWRGSGPNSLDQPEYEVSVFSGQLRLGAAYSVLRAPRATTINFEQIILGHFLLGAQSYNALLVIDGLTHTSVGTSVRGSSQAVGSPFTPGTLIRGLSVIVTTGETSIPDTFSVQPCRGASFQTPAVSECEGERVYPVTFSLAPRTAPYAGPGYALQLMQEGGFVQLARPSTSTFTLEFNLRLTKPFKRGTSILSIQRQASSTAHDPLHLWLDSARGGAVLEVCTGSGASSQATFVPEIGTLDAQHIAITFSYLSGRYSINVFKDCVLVATVTVPNSCYAFNDESLREPTLGQRYRDNEPGAVGASHPWSTNFCAMYVSEMRMWSNVRGTQAICSAMVTRLTGTEAGLYMYAPVLAEDSARAATEEELAVEKRTGALLEVKKVTAGGSFVLQTGVVTAPNTPAPPKAQVMCSADVGVCPDASSGIGWMMRLGIFANTPPEETLLETTTTVNLQASFEAADLDNLVDNLLAPISRDSTVWDIVDFPDPVCLLLFENGANQFIPTPLTDPTRATFGLPATERVTAANLPLLMEPFGGALLAQITAANGACSTTFTYRAVDTGSGQVSPHLALVRFNVWRPGPVLLNVTAVEVGVGDDGLDGGDVLLFYFDLPAETEYQDPRDIFDVQDGSWGTSTPVGSWVESSTVFVVTLGGGLRAGGASFTPGATRFQVKRSAVVRRVGDSLSKPCTTLSSPLAGSFNSAICAVGQRFSVANGTCLPCPAGTYWTTTGNGRGVEAVACEPCENGQFGNSTALTACFDCERGYYMPADETDRTTCLQAPPGTFVAEVGEDIATPCPLDAVQETPAQLSCYACPTNSSCNGGATPQGPVAAGTMAIPVAGHFRFSATRFPSCAVPSACYGGGFCKEGHQSPELGCYECRPSWHRWESMLRHRSECFECPSEGLGYLAFVAVVFCSLLLALPLAALGFSIAFRSECMHLFMIKILLNHLAMMHIFTTFEIWEMRDGFGDMADALRHIFTALFTWDGSVPVYAVPLRCLLEDRMEDFTAKERLWAELILWTVLPIAFPLFCTALGLLYAEGYVLIGACARRMRKPQPIDMSGVVPAARAGSADLQRGSTQTSVESGVSRHSGLSRASTSSTVSGTWDVSVSEERLLGIWRKSPAGMSWKKRLSRFGQDTFAICVATSMLIYAPTVRQLLTFLQCGPITGDPLHDQRMLVAPQYSCDDDDYNSFAMLAWPALLVWGVGLPLTAALMLWDLQSSWAAFSTRCKVALLGADYHPSYFFWEAVVRLRTFAVIVAGSVTTNVPRIAMLGMLLTVGLIFLCLHAIHLPFDNRSGQLLDRVEEHGLGIFCTMCAALLLGFADIMPDGVAFAMVFLVWLADVCYILHSLWLIWEQVRRSMADAHVEVQLTRRQLQKDPSLLAVGQRCQEKAFKWAFNRQSEVEEKRAKVKFDHRANALKLIPGEAGKPVQDTERLAFVQGLSDCISHAVIDAKVESLSVYFLEYIMRHAFSVYFVKQCDEGHLREALRDGRRKSSAQSSGGRSRLNSAESARADTMAAAAAAASAAAAQAQQADGPFFRHGSEEHEEQEEASPRPADGRKRISFLEEEGGEPHSEPASPRGAQSMASRRRRSTVTKVSALSVEGLMKVSKYWLFRADPYEDGMSLTDIQATLIKFLSFTKHSLENNYFQFMRKRGAKGEYKLKPRDRILHKVGLDKPKHVKKKESIELGAPLVADPPPRMEAAAQAETAQPVASSRAGHTALESLPGANPVSATEQEDRLLDAPESRMHPALPPLEGVGSRAGEASMEAEDIPRETAELRMDRSRRALGDFEPPPDGKPRNSQSELMAAAMGFGPSSSSSPATGAPLLVTRSGVAGPQLSETLR